MHTINDDTIVAISTPVGEGGIGIVRLSGPSALAIAEDIFVAKDNIKVRDYESHTTHYGHVVDKGSRGTKYIDEVLLTVMKAPRTYTKEDIVEINCHGGIQAVKKVLELAVKCGSRIAEPGEFTKRAFLNGRIDLVQAEAVLDIIRARTEGSLKAAVGQLEGELSRKINEMREELINMASQIEAAIDFPDEDLEIMKEADVSKRADGVLQNLKEMAGTFDNGVILREGILITICGKPNVGKSSLMNLLLKRDRVIVSPMPGTTRDAVEEMINLKGLPIRLADTAGIVQSDDAVERESIKKTRKYLKLSDIAILMLDNSSGISDDDMDIAGLIGPKKKIVVINKCDLPKKIETQRAKEMFGDDTIVEISVEKKKNIALLEKAILDSVWKGSFDQSQSAILTNARHKELLDKSLANMLSVKKAIGEHATAEIIVIDLKEAIFNLGLIIGKSVADDILDRIFEQFCIGK